MPRKKAEPQEYYVKFATADGSNDALFVNVTCFNQIPMEVRRQTLYRKVIIYSAKRVVHVKCPQCGSNSALVTDKLNVVACAMCGTEHDQNNKGEET